MVNLTSSTLITVIAFLALFIGYAVGRRTGRREGFLEGTSFAPLELRRRSWERGACVVCGRQPGSQERGTKSQATL